MGRSCGQALLTAVKTMNDLRYPNADLVSCSRQSSRAVCITSNDSAMPCFTLWWVLPPFKLRSYTGELCDNHTVHLPVHLPASCLMYLTSRCLKKKCHIYLSEHQSLMCESAARAHRLCMKPHFCRVLVPTISLLIRRYWIHSQDMQPKDIGSESRCKSKGKWPLSFFKPTSTIIQLF